MQLHGSAKRIMTRARGPESAAPLSSGVRRHVLFGAAITALGGERQDDLQSPPALGDEDTRPQGLSVFSAAAG